MKQHSLSLVGHESLVRSIFLCIVLWGGLPLLSQKLNVDSAFVVSHQLIVDGRYQEAQPLLEQIVAQSPDYVDVVVALGRTYMWDKRYDEAITQFNRALQTDKKNSEALEALTDVYLYSDQPTMAMSVVTRALDYMPLNAPLLYRKARVYNALGNPRQAYEYAGLAIASNPSEGQYRRYQRSLLDLLLNNKMEVNYTLDLFGDRNISDWHQAYIQYGRQMPIGSVIARVNYANKFNSNAVQFEVDSYLDMTKWNYLYLNAGYSNQQAFPRYRFGLELFQKLPKAFELSAGVRFLDYPSGSTTIYTASLGKYIKNWWFSGRSYFTFDKSNNSFSVLLNARYYTNTRDDYWGARLNYGLSPDENHIILGQSPIDLKSWGGRIEYSRQLSTRICINGYLSYNRLEWMSNQYRNNFTISVSSSYRF